MPLRTLLAVSMLTAITPAFAQEDLTLPPEFRSPAPTSAQAKTSPDAKPRGLPTAKRTPAQTQTTKPGRDAASAAVPSKQTQEDHLSVGVSWKANNTAPGATWATSGLPQENKNHPDEAAGAGGLFGLKYKF